VFRTCLFDQNPLDSKDELSDCKTISYWEKSFLWENVRVFFWYLIKTSLEKWFDLQN
jgi:hypothetical protein